MKHSYIRVHAHNVSKEVVLTGLGRRETITIGTYRMRDQEVRAGSSRFTQRLDRRRVFHVS